MISAFSMRWRRGWQSRPCRILRLVAINHVETAPSIAPALLPFPAPRPGMMLVADRSRTASDARWTSLRSGVKQKQRSALEAALLRAVNALEARRVEKVTVTRIWGRGASWAVDLVHEDGSGRLHGDRCLAIQVGSTVGPALLPFPIAGVSSIRTARVEFYRHQPRSGDLVTCALADRRFTSHLPRLTAPIHLHAFMQ